MRINKRLMIIMVIVMLFGFCGVAMAAEGSIICTPSGITTIMPSENPVTETNPVLPLGEDVQPMITSPSGEEISLPDNLIPMQTENNVKIDSVEQAQRSGGGGSISYKSSTPITSSIYYANYWSSLVSWDLRNDPLCQNATVTGVQLRWRTMPTSGYSGMVVGLYKQDGYGYYVSNDFRDNRFNGQPAAQIWYSRFGVTQWNSPGYALTYVPELTIYFTY